MVEEQLWVDNVLITVKPKTITKNYALSKRKIDKVSVEFEGKEINFDLFKLAEFISILTNVGHNIHFINKRNSISECTNYITESCDTVCEHCK
jgi:hypothetical protein